MPHNPHECDDNSGGSGTVENVRSPMGRFKILARGLLKVKLDKPISHEDYKDDGASKGAFPEAFPGSSSLTRK